MIKKILRKTFDMLSVARFYFVRGHSIYLNLPLSMLNTSLIVYNFLIKNMENKPAIFDSYVSFTIVFLLVFLPCAFLMGLFDYHKGMYQRECKETLRVSPIWKDIYGKLDTIIDEVKKKDNKGGN